MKEAGRGGPVVLGKGPGCGRRAGCALKRKHAFGNVVRVFRPEFAAIFRMNPNGIPHSSPGLAQPRVREEYGIERRRCSGGVPEVKIIVSPQIQ